MAKFCKPDPGLPNSPPKPTANVPEGCSWVLPRRQGFHLGYPTSLQAPSGTGWMTRSFSTCSTTESQRSSICGVCTVLSDSRLGLCETAGWPPGSAVSPSCPAGDDQAGASRWTPSSSAHAVAPVHPCGFASGSAVVLQDGHDSVPTLSCPSPWELCVSFSSLWLQNPGDELPGLPAGPGAPGPTPQPGSSASPGSTCSSVLISRKSTEDSLAAKSRSSLHVLHAVTLPA